MAGMEKLRQGLQIMRIAMLIGIALYVYIILHVPSEAKPDPFLFWIMVVLAISMVGGLFVVRRVLVSPAVEVLRTQPDDARARHRWWNGNMITYAFCEAIALYGVVLHFLGSSGKDVAPFFIAGAGLLLVFPPRIPES